MDCRFLTNDDNAFAAALRECLRTADEAWLLVAYARHDAFHEFSDSITAFLERGGRLRSLFDLEKLATDPDLLEELATIRGDSQCRGFMKTPGAASEDLDEKGLFHAKLYAFRCGRRWQALIGSSNLTMGGTSRNHEANLLVRGTERSTLFRTLREYMTDIWNSRFVLPIDDDRLLQAYRQAVQTYRRSEQRTRRTATVTKFQSSWDAAFAHRTNRIPNLEIAYLWGLLCGAGYVNLATADVHVDYRRGELNKGTPHAGRIYFKGISALNLAQDDALDADAEAVASALNNLFNRAQSGDRASWERSGRWRRRITTRFRDRSPFLQEIRRYCAQTTIDPKHHVAPHVPTSIMDSGDSGLKVAFLRGYCDIKCRVGVTDRLPDGPLRVALSIPGGSEAFGEQLIGLMEDVVPDAHPNLLKAEPRGKETLIRVDAREFPSDLLSATWKKQAVDDFAKFNEVNY